MKIPTEYIRIFPLLLLAQASPRALVIDAGPLKLDMQVVEAKFRGEGVAVVDVDKDGVLDVMVGDFWYKGPAWTRYEIRKPGDYQITDYSEAMNVWAEDVTGDGYPDEIVFPFPGRPVKWYENPKGGTGRWNEYLVGFDYYNEQPRFTTLLSGDPKRYLVSGNKNGRRFSYFRPGSDPKVAWKETPISSDNAPNTDLFDHGLGIGDLNGDGKLDLIEPNGYYEQTADPAKWTYRSKKFDPTNEESGFMHIYDFNGDGLNDMLTGASHNYGVSWFEQKPGNTWVKHEIDRSFSEVHSMYMADMDNDGVQDIITGKRKYAHNGGDVGGQQPAILVWYKVTKGATPKFDRYVIQADNAGVGTDFEVKDYNKDGWMDFAVANKTGTKIYMQVGKPSKLNLNTGSRIYNPARAGLVRIFQGSADRLFPDASPGFRILTADGRIVPSR